MSKTLDDIQRTLFHSYDARGNQLAIDESKAQIKALVLEQLDTCDTWEELRKAVEAL